MWNNNLRMILDNMSQYEYLYRYELFDNGNIKLSEHLFQLIVFSYDY